MDKKLHILQHLYDEADTPDDLLRDDALRAEYAALREVKTRLDQRERPRPDAAVLDRIFEVSNQTASSAAATVRRADRAPRRRARYALLAALTACAVVVVVGIGLMQRGVLTPPSAKQEAIFSDAAPEAPAPPAAHDEAEADGLLFEERVDADQEGGEAVAFRQRPALDAPVAHNEPAQAGRSREAFHIPAPGDEAVAEGESLTLTDRIATPYRSAAAPPAALKAQVEFVSADTPDSLLAWDEAPELLEVHRRIEWLKARSAANTWDEPALLSLDALPLPASLPSRGEQGIRQAGTQPVKKDHR